MLSRILGRDTKKEPIDLSGVPEKYPEPSCFACAGCCPCANQCPCCGRRYWPGTWFPSYPWHTGVVWC